MATSSDLSRRQQRAGRVTGWPLQPTNAPPLLLGRHDNLTACPWLLTMLIGEAVFLQSCSWILLFPILGLAPASYFLPQDTRAGHLETDWSFPLWEHRLGHFQGQVRQTFAKSLTCVWLMVGGKNTGSVSWAIWATPCPVSPCLLWSPSWRCHKISLQTLPAEFTQVARVLWRLNPSSPAEWWGPHVLPRVPKSQQYALAGDPTLCFVKAPQGLHPGKPREHVRSTWRRKTMRLTCVHNTPLCWGCSRLLQGCWLEGVCDGGKQLLTLRRRSDTQLCWQDNSASSHPLMCGVGKTATGESQQRVWSGHNDSPALGETA